MTPEDPADVVPSFPVTEPRLHTGDEVEEKIRPGSLSDFQGQEGLKQNLRVFIQAARERGEPLDHVFLNGPPGLGKTTLAGIIANEMGSELRLTSAPALDKPRDLAGILTTITPQSVFFIDEIHRLKPAIEEMLYIAMEDFEIDWVIGQGPSARNIRIPLPPFTLIGATTKAGSVSSPLISRFGISVRIDLYSPEEIILILRRSAEIMEVEVAEGALELMARCARGTPRVANRILRRMRDFAQVLASGVVDRPVVLEGMRRLRIDQVGLEEQDRKLLMNIITHYDGGPVGAETLAIMMGESVDTLEDYYEPFLIQQGYLKRTPRGRMATARAYEHLSFDPSGSRRPAGDGKGGTGEDQGLLF
jgi:Holliday junction DNA helicase RuvB